MATASKSLQKYLKSVEQANAGLRQRWAYISNHLSQTLPMPLVDSSILLKTYESPSYFVGADGRNHRKPIRALYGLGQSARDAFKRDLASYERYCAVVKAEIEAGNKSVEYWRNRAQAGDSDAVRWYCETVLPWVLPKPPGGNAYLVTGYSAAERHLVIERYMPGLGVIPKLYRYEVAGNWTLRQVETADRDREVAYLSLLAQVALLSADRVFRSEIGGVLDIATVNCVTAMRNPATGHIEATCVLSVSVPQRQLNGLNLLGVDPITCVQSLGGRLTSSPGYYAPVLPWVDAQATGDFAITVADTPLLDMDPTEFEHLITELMRRMGLRAESTGRSGDGGVDCVAFDDRPVVGGKVIVQVKRYAKTVNPSVVRDLFGTVIASGATKGVLITTSGFGPESRKFEQDKPLDLIDGVELDVLLRQFKLAGTMSQDPLTSSVQELQQDAPPISPDGRYYWDGTAWKIIADR
jgi:restriction system protein